MTPVLFLVFILLNGSDPASTDGRGEADPGAQIAAAEVSLRQDFQKLSSVSYTAAWSFTDFYYQRPTNPDAKSLAELSFEQARYDAPQTSNGTFSVAISGESQKVDVRAIVVAPAHVRFSFADGVTIHGNDKNVTHVSADGRRVVVNPNLKGERARPTDLMTLTPQSLLLHQLNLDEFFAIPVAEPLPAGVSRNRTRRVLPNEEDEPGLSSDLTVLDELVVMGIEEREGTFKRSRITRFASDQGFRPRSVKNVRGSTLQSRYDFEWEQIDADNHKIWFPRKVRATSTIVVDGRVRPRREMENTFDLSSMRIGTPGSAAELQPSYAENANVTTIAPGSVPVFRLGAPRIENSKPTKGTARTSLILVAVATSAFIVGLAVSRRWLLSRGSR